MQNKKICNIDKIKLFSFDIFDTLITRKTIAPDGIFAIMQKIINSDENFISLDKDVKTNFFNYRKYSEHICSSKSGRYINEFQETTLNEIYSDLQKTFLIPSDMIEKLMALEIKVEYDNSVGIKENIDKVKFLIQNKKRVVLISDMYLDHKTIRNMLLKADEIFKDIPIYVSSETGCKKTTGLMYEYVKNKEKVEYKEWHHTGDNLWADAGSALSYGINIDLYTKSEAMYHEKFYAGLYPTNLSIQLILGQSRQVRLNGIESDKYKLGASYTGVLLYPFLSWLLDKVTKMGIKRLYFLMRDCYAIKKACDTLIEQMGLDIKTEYIYCSRTSLRAPSITEDNIELYKQFICASFDNYSMLSFFSGLETKEIKNFLPLNYKYLAGRKFKLQKKKIAKVLYTNNELLNKIIEKNKEKRELAIGYLKQILDVKDDNFAFVDLNGSGLSANNIANLMKDFYGTKPIKFFFMYAPNAVFQSIGAKTFYYSSVNEKNAISIASAEAILRPNFGSTIGYKKENEKYYPVFDSDIIKGKDPFDKEYLMGILDVTKALFECERNYPNVCFSDTIIVDKYLQYLASDMNRDFAKIIGAKSYQYWGLESTNMGKKLSLFELIKFTLKKNPVPKGGIIISKQCSDYFTRLIMEMKLYIFNTKKENKNSLRKHHYINKSLSIQCMDFKNTDRKSLDKTPVGGGGIKNPLFKLAI